MTENYNDYDIENIVRHVAATLQISGCSVGNNKPLNEIVEAIQERCPKAGDILLEKIFEKDKFKSYLASRPPFPVINGNIDGEGDETFDKFWNDQVALYPMLLEAIDDCNKKQ